MPLEAEGSKDMKIRDYTIVILSVTAHVPIVVTQPVSQREANECCVLLAKNVEQPLTD